MFICLYDTSQAFGHGYQMFIQVTYNATTYDSAKTSNPSDQTDQPGNAHKCHPSVSTVHISTHYIYCSSNCTV